MGVGTSGGGLFVFPPSHLQKPAPLLFVYSIASQCSGGGGGERKGDRRLRVNAALVCFHFFQ